MDVRFPNLTALVLSLGLTPLHAQWVKTSGPDSARVLITERGVAVWAGTRSGVFLSRDSGATWVARNNGLTHRNVRSGILRRNTMFVGTEGGGFFRSADSGLNWEPRNNGLTSLDVRALAYFESHLFAATSGGVFRSGDNGVNWTAFNTGLTSLDVRALAVDPGGHPASMGLYVGTEGAGVFWLASGATSWSARNDSLKNLNVRALAYQESWIYAGTSAGAYKWSPDRGYRWDILTTPPAGTEIQTMMSSLSAADVTGWVLAGTAGAGIFLMNGYGTHRAVNEGLTDLNVQAISSSFAFSDAYLFAGTPSGIWRRPAPQVIPAGIAPEPAQESPLRFSVGSSSLSFNLLSPGRVTLTAHSATGRTIAVLLDEPFAAGSHERRLRTGSLPNGLYVYRLRAGKTSETKKVLLTR